MVVKTDFFKGNGQEKTVGGYQELPEIDVKSQSDPRFYEASPELAGAVNAALLLGMPLLLTGEPGCGKSELARRLAWELDFPKIDEQNATEETVLTFSVKSTTEARDLFYTYDSIGRFHAAQEQRHFQSSDKKTASIAPSQHPAYYIHYQALGLALLRTKGYLAEDDNKKPVLNPELSGLVLPKHLHYMSKKPVRSVVLIDEIDKAPRDVPNDILNEIERMEFYIPELSNRRVSLSKDRQKFRPIVIFTSNNESELPDPFLRRCVYFHVEFPPFSQDTTVTKHHSPVTVESIVASRLGKRFESHSTLVQEALDLCRDLRLTEHGLIKVPGLAEILSFIQLLMTEVKVDHSRSSVQLRTMERPVLEFIVKATLLKKHRDQARASILIEQFFQKKADQSIGRV